MMAPEYYVFTGRDGERIPDHITHVLIDKALKFVRARPFRRHQKIQEVICHEGVFKVEQEAFYDCPRLRRIIMPGVKNIEPRAFSACAALTYVECGKLERIGYSAFHGCKSLSSIDLPSIRIVEGWAFLYCKRLMSVTFGKDLQTIGEHVFHYCFYLERIALPLKHLITSDNTTFQRCVKLNHVDLVGEVHETVAALLMEEWKNYMNEEIDSINRILPSTPAGDSDDILRNTHSGNDYIVDGKAREIRTWITSVLRKIIHYKAEHRRYLDVAAAALQPALQSDILFKNECPSFPRITVIHIPRGE